MTLADPKVHRFTRAEYYRMAQDGYFEDQRVELLDGEILDMSPQNHPHAWTISFLTHFLGKHLPPEFYLRVQLPLAVSEHDEPEPDFAIIRGRLEDLKDHPNSAALIIEVAYDSQTRDRRKADLYAQAGVEEYWIVNLRAQQIVQHQNLTSGQYQSIRTLGANESITCAVVALPTRSVKDFFPPL